MLGTFQRTVAIVALVVLVIALIFVAISADSSEGIASTWNQLSVIAPERNSVPNYLGVIVT